jgi:dTDP-4-dehydrorhamnose reductase
MNMRVLILGASGMLGRTVFLKLMDTRNIELGLGIRPGSSIGSLGPPAESASKYEFDATNPDRYRELFRKFKPDWVINCMGVVKQREEASNALNCIRVNSALPHWLALECDAHNARLIHISTDCVFRGEHGGYSERDIPDATDLYGRTKILGEVTNKSNCLTIRTSIIGHEFKSRLGLLDWFLGECKSVEGYAQAYFSGLTTLELADIITNEISIKSPRSGLLHIGGPKISKLNLLNTIGPIYGHTVRIIPNIEVKIDRSLNSSKWLQLSGYEMKSWEIMLRQLKEWRDNYKWVWH